ncbi:MAG: hypothetical protein ACFE9Q_08465 [Candidatus Hodarchaeota archaeon]
MVELNKEDKEFLSFKIIQSGEIKKVPLTLVNMNKNFRNIYLSLLKELKLKEKDTFLSNEEGKMIGLPDLSLSLEEIVRKFGTILKLYSEKIF